MFLSPFLFFFGERELRVHCVDENTATIIKLSRVNLLFVDNQYLDIGLNEGSSINVGQTVALKNSEGTVLLSFVLRRAASL